MIRKVLSFLSPVFPFLAGCVTTIDARTYTDANWPIAREKLGRVVILPARYDTPEGVEEISQLTSKAIVSLPNTEVVDPGPFLAELGQPLAATPISDYEAVLAARKLNLDTVCLLTVGRYGGYFGMSLPPVVWKSETTLVYGLRLIDAASGKLLLDTVRRRSTGGFYAVRSARDLPEELLEDLASLFALDREEHKIGQRDQREVQGPLVLRRD